MAAIMAWPIVYECYQQAPDKRYIVHIFYYLFSRAATTYNCSIDDDLIILENMGQICHCPFTTKHSKVCMVLRRYCICLIIYTWWSHMYPTSVRWMGHVRNLAKLPPVSLHVVRMTSVDKTRRNSDPVTLLYSSWRVLNILIKYHTAHDGWRQAII